MRPRTLLALAGAALILTACANMPTSGPVHAGIAVGAGSEEQSVRVIAAPPRSGMTPQEIVQGFLVASASFNDGMATARKYLTPTRAATWQPAAGVQVFAQDGLQLDGNDASVVGHGSLVATIDASGEYRISQAATAKSITFGLQLVGGQWRIANVPDGLLLSQLAIDRSFRSYDVYFYDPSFETLVPDPVTIPVAGATAATQLVEDLLAGPTRWLAKAVRTAFPADTHLTVAAVPIVDGVAQVDLSSAALGADDHARQALSGQLVWTLKALPEITGVRITVNGQPFTVPGAPTVQPTSSWAALDPSGGAQAQPAVAWYGGRPTTVRLAATPPAAPQSVPGQARWLALSWSGRSAAVGTAAGLSIGPAGGTPLVRLEEPVAGRMSFDRDGGLWWVSGGKLRYLPGAAALKAGARPKPVSVPVSGLGGDSLVGVALARDGVRAVLELARAGGTSLVLARVTGSSVPLVDGLRPLLADPVTPTGFAWAGPDEVAVLGTSGGDVASVIVQVATGAAQQLGSPASPQSIAATSGSPILIGGGDGLLYQSVGGTWVAAAVGTSPAYPG